jgi:hypothetical protein
MGVAVVLYAYSSRQIARLRPVNRRTHIMIRRLMVGGALVRWVG